MSLDPGFWTRRMLLVTAFALAAVGFALAAWLGGGLLPQGRFLVAGLVWLAWVGISVVVVMSTWKLAMRRLNRRLDPFREGSAHQDIIALVERLSAERTQAVREIKTLHEDLEHIQISVQSTLEGTGDPVWPVSGRTGRLADAIQTLLGDRRDDAAKASELLAMWIQQTELLQVRVQQGLENLDTYRVQVQESSWGKSLSEPELGSALRELRRLLNTKDQLVGERGVGGGSNKPLASSLSRLSEALEGIEKEIARAEEGDRESRAAGEELSRAYQGVLAALAELERDARNLRRRLGGDAATELKEEDFIG